eukprot:scaffold2366_cov115-Cylindrotheca_fusiformis.AAC.17
MSANSGNDHTNMTAPLPVRSAKFERTFLWLLFQQYQILHSRLTRLNLDTNQWERPYQHDSTASRPLSEVKHVRAWLVLRWGTTLESQSLPPAEGLKELHHGCTSNNIRFCIYELQKSSSTTTDGNDHTNMTAPLPVRSAKLSMFGPDFETTGNLAFILLLARRASSRIKAYMANNNSKDKE